MRALIVGVLVALSLDSARAEPIKVYIIAGQSNAMGYGKLAELPGLGYSDVATPLPAVRYNYFLDSTNPPYPIDSTGWTSLQPIPDPSMFGVELTLARALLEQRPNESIAILKWSRTGADLGRCWNPDSTEAWQPNGWGGLYGAAVAYSKAAIAELAAAGLEPEVAGMFWIQGESDAGSESWANAYEANLRNLVSHVRADFGAPNIPFVLNQLHPGVSHPPYDFVPEVREAQSAVAGSTPHVAMVNLDDQSLLADNLHFSTSMLLEAGLRLAAGYVEAAEPLLVGDVDLDRDVDIFDVATIQVHYGKTSGATWTEGDFDGNGTVDIFDVAAMQPQYGVGVANAPLAVPEASTSALALQAALCCLGAFVLKRRLVRRP